MFNIRTVRESVVAKLAVIGRVDEAVIHDLYARAIFEELKGAHRSTRNLERAMIMCVKIRHSESKWVMVDKSEWDAVHNAVDVLAGQFKL